MASRKTLQEESDELQAALGELGNELARALYLDRFVAWLATWL